MNEAFASFIVTAVKEIRWYVLCCETLSILLEYIVLINKMWAGQLQLQAHLYVVFHEETVGWKIKFITVWLQYLQWLQANFSNGFSQSLKWGNETTNRFSNSHLQHVFPQQLQWIPNRYQCFANAFLMPCKCFYKFNGKPLVQN